MPWVVEIAPEVVAIPAVVVEVGAFVVFVVGYLFGTLLTWDWYRRGSP